MKKVIILALCLLICGPVLAQTYPTPTFSTLTLIHPLTPANGGTGVTSATGTGDVVLNDSPTLIAPNLGTPTSVSLANATGLPLTSGVSGILPIENGGTGTDSSTGSGVLVKSLGPSIYNPTLTAPILTNASISGVVDGSDAADGDVGQFLSDDGSQSLVTDTAANVATLSLPPGDWDVSGGCAIAAATAVITSSSCGLSTSSATLGLAGTYANSTATAFTSTGGAVPALRVSSSSTTQVYLVGKATFASGSTNANGFLQARRVR